MSRILLFGLGNPGAEYEGTRHNTGFRVIDLIGHRTQAVCAPGKGDYSIAWADIAGREVALVKPLTYMNNSGEAVLDAMGRYEVPLSDILVICDDLALPLGQLRLRPRGSDGGHNGLYSIIYHLGSEEFPRLRCGIGQERVPPGEMMADFVLSPFEATEEAAVRTMVRSAADASLEFVSSGISRAMNRYNA